MKDASSRYSSLISDFWFKVCFVLTQAEGIIAGTIVTMFIIAGPVIVSGTAVSAVYGPVPGLTGV